MIPCVLRDLGLWLGKQQITTSIAKQAIKINSFIPSLLKKYTDNIGLDAHLQPIEAEYYSSGSTEEAEIYAKENFNAWFTNGGAIDWLLQLQ